MRSLHIRREEFTSRKTASFIEPTKEDLAKAEENDVGMVPGMVPHRAHVIHDRRLLRSLGFLTASGAPVSDEVARD